ncbi:sodium channel protein 60E-like [Palaemon carinicauda]|uniref:sodium channel protein 60E-like n=1 Tax=Palaemon carinicauda TaxID=392227 RepID=UPI0035B6A4DF
MTLTVFCLMVFALFALQVYMGVLMNKCVKYIDINNITNREWNEWVNNSANWFMENGTDHPDLGNPRLCGNATGARVCPEGYMCLPDIGTNPNFGYTSFDNFLWSMLTTFQLITLDYWEDVYNKVIATGGPLQVVFFAIVVFFGSFYLINLMLAVVAMSYEEEAENTEEEKTKDLMDHRDDSTFSFDPEKLTHARPLERKQPKNRRVVVMRRGAGIISDAFNKKIRKKQRDKDTKGREGGSPSSEGTPRAPDAPPTTPRLGGSQLGVSEGNQSLSRPASLVITPPPSTTPARSTPNTTPPSRCKVEGHPLPEGEGGSGGGGGGKGPAAGEAGGGGAPGKTGPSSSCEPCTAASARCCTCHCHTKHYSGSKGPAPVQGVVALRGGACEDPRSHLRLANNSSHRQPSLDDSGVVGDHDGGDTMSIHHLPHIVQEPVVKAEQSLYSRRKCNGVSPTSPAALSASSQHIVVVEEEVVDRNCEKCRDCCVDYRSWLRFQNIMYIVVHDAVFDLFIMLCIIMNTVFLAIEHHGMSDTLNKILEVGNRVFTAVFTLECIMKIMALSKEFFTNKWNVFDLVIVLASLLDLGLEIGSGLSVLRGMRLLRVLKLAQSWRTMRVLLSIIVSTLGALGNLTFVLIIIIYIFAVIGMQLFGKNYHDKNFAPDPVPRWNFSDFFHSFMMIFRILCGEWVEPLWDCMRAEKNGGSNTCLAIFLPALVMGNFMVLNLFLALLLNSFNSEELKSRQDDMEDESRVLQLFVRLKNAIFRLKKKKKPEDESVDGDKKKSSLESIIPDRGVKQAFSEPEIRTRCQEEELDLDPQMQGYKRLTIIDKNNHNSNLAARPPQENGHAEKNNVNGKKVKFQGDDDQPEIIELSDFNPGDPQFALCSQAKRHQPDGSDGEGMESEYRDGPEGEYHQYTSAGVPREYPPTGEYRDESGNDYSHEHDYHQLQFPESNLSEGNGYNNEDSVSEVNLSDGNIPKMKLDAISFRGIRRSSSKDIEDFQDVTFHSQPKESIGKPLGNGGPRGRYWQAVKKDMPKSLNKTQSWNAVINYVDTITTGVKDDEDPRFKRTEIKAKEPADCFPRQIFSKIRCCQTCTETGLYRKFYLLRQSALYVVDSPYFEWFILLLIFASSVTLCFEDVHLDSKTELKEILKYLNLTFAILFTLEMVVKWIAVGFVKYFSSVWTLLDCFIVMVSLCSLFIKQDNLIALRSLRTLRALRPLRAISRWEGMKKEWWPCRVESDGPAKVVMSHRRSSSLTGSAKVCDIRTSAQQRTAKPPPLLKASSLDVGGEHGGEGVAAGPSNCGGEYDDGGSRSRLAHSSVFTAARNAYSALETKGGSFINRFDSELDELEHGALVQTAKATVQKAAIVIEKPVGRIKQSKFVEEVSGVIEEIEKNEVVQAVSGKARQAYMYVEPIGEKILARVGSLDADEKDDKVQFVIPPSSNRAPIKSVEDYKPRPILRPYEIDFRPFPDEPRYRNRNHYGSIAQEDVPRIQVSGEDGRCSVLSQGSDNLLKVKAPDQLSIVSATDSERQYEIVRPHKFYRTPPCPPPKPRHRRSLEVRISNSGVKTSLVDENSETRRLLENEEKKVDLNRSVRFSDAAPGDSSTAPKKSPNTGDKDQLGVRTVVDVKERRPALKDTRAHDSIDNRNSVLDVCGEDEPLVPIAESFEGCSIIEIRQKLRELDCNVVVINGKTFYVPKSAVKESEKEVYGGASAFFEASQSIDWATVKEARGHLPPAKERPRWMQRVATGLENFISNAHDPWLSEADRDPLACDAGCGCLDPTTWNKKTGPMFPRHQKNELIKRIYPLKASPLFLPIPESPPSTIHPPTNATNVLPSRLKAQESGDFDISDYEY